MATLINNSGVQHYANQMTKAENRKVGSKSLPQALSDIDTKLDEMKTLFDEEYGSSLDMTLENNENVFTVGTGSGVDKSSEVENSFSDICISGNSMVNLIYPSSIQEKKIVMGNRSLKLCQDTLIKPNTTYTIIADATFLNLDGLTSIQIDIQISKFGMGGKTVFYVDKLGRYIGTITTSDILPNPDSLNGWVMIKGHGTQWEQTSSTSRAVTFKNYLILEGDYTDKPIPSYFTGLKSVGNETEDGKHKISILSQGKNLFDISRLNERGNYSPNIVDLKNATVETNAHNSSVSGNGYIITNLIPNKTYYLTATCIQGTGNINIGKPDGTGWYEQKLFFSQNELGQTKSKTIISSTGNLVVTINRLGDVNNGQTVIFKNISITENPIITYEPYKSDKKEILLNEPLRALPNGVKDSIELINGEWKIARRCGEIVLNGTETWKPSLIVSENCVRFYFKWNHKTNSQLLCDKFVYKESLAEYSEDYECCFSDITLAISILKSKLGTVSIDGFNSWLSQNNVTLIYELATPIYEDIEPLTLQVWNNGTISIDEVLPVTSTHTVALSKPAQIKRNIEELTKLRDRVTSLEEFYSVLALEQARSLSLVNTDIQVDYLSSLE